MLEAEVQISNREITLIKILGIKIALDYSWFWVFFLVLFSFSANLLPRLKPDQPLVIYFTYGLLGTVIFFTSIVLHELSHTLVARKNNLPIKRITLFIFGGSSNLTQEPASAWIEFKMAIAGPLASLIIGLMLIGLNLLIKRPDNLFLMLLELLGFINLGLALFNLIPGFPLDGGRVLRSFLWWQSRDLLKATRLASFVGQIVAVLLGLFGFWQIINFGLLSGIWLIFISIFLYQAAGSSYLQTLAFLTLGKASVGDLANTNFSIVPPSTPLRELLQPPIKTNSFVTKESGNYTGLIDVRVLDRLEQSDIDEPASRFITLINRSNIIKPSGSALAALERLSRSDVLAVMDNGNLKGTISKFDVVAFIRQNQSNKTGEG